MLIPRRANINPAEDIPRRRLLETSAADTTLTTRASGVRIIAFGLPHLHTAVVGVVH